MSDEWEALGDSIDWREVVTIMLGIAAVSAPFWLFALGWWWLS